MLFRRKIYDKFLTWKKETGGKKALLVEGARRIGKSTVVEEFAKNEYRSYILIDFARANETVKGYFLEHLNDLDTFFMLLSVEYGVTLYPRESIIVFDEVQMFPKAREAIKYLVADGRYDYIETGSLISIKENVKDIVIPSEERHIKMYPLDFEEFCWALQEEPLVGYIRSCFDKREPLERSLHNKAMLLWGQYLLVGGMPMSVVAFLEGHKDFGKADQEKRDILELYRNDIMKIRAQYRSKVLAIFDQIPGLLSRHEKRVVFNRIAAGSTADQYEETFFWLADSMVANECRRAMIRMLVCRSANRMPISSATWVIRDCWSATLLTRTNFWRTKSINRFLLGSLESTKACCLRMPLRRCLLPTGIGCFSIRNTMKRRNETTLRLTSLSPTTAKRNIKSIPLK